MAKEIVPDDSILHHVVPLDESKNRSAIMEQGLSSSKAPSQAPQPDKTTAGPASALTPPIKRLTDQERITLINAIGGYTMNPPLDVNNKPPAPGPDPDPEKGTRTSSFPSYATSAKNLPDGLVKSVLHARARARHRFLVTSFFYNTFIVLQLLLGATMTALAPSRDRTIAITVLAAMNTVTAGAIALLHNSGLPNRLQNDYNAYTKVENHLMEVMNSGVVPAEYTVNDAIARCWDMYEQAKTTVENNKPANYIDAPNGKPGGLAESPKPGLHAGG